MDNCPEIRHQPHPPLKTTGVGKELILGDVHTVSCWEQCRDMRNKYRFHLVTLNTCVSFRRFSSVYSAATEAQKTWAIQSLVNELIFFPRDSTTKYYSRFEDCSKVMSKAHSMEQLLLFSAINDLSILCLPLVLLYASDTGELTDIGISGEKRRRGKLVTTHYLPYSFYLKHRSRFVSPLHSADS